jgi:NitT/TauT family transport system substrate-binding protein
MVGKAWLWGAAVLAASVGTAAAAPQTVRVAIGGRALVTYLPFTLADTLGYFKDAGIAADINDFKGGSQAVEALVGGSVEMAVGAYEHTLVLQSKGIAIKAVALLNNSYGAVIALKPALAKTYKSPADLAGLKFGVTAPGSSSALALELLLAKANLPITKIAIVGIGGGQGALVAGKSGELDGVSQFDPVVTPLLRDGDFTAIVDTRNADGMKFLYGGYIAGSAALTTATYIADHRATVQSFATAVVRALKWLQTASPADVSKAVPAAYYGNERALYEQEVALNHPSFSPDGVIPSDAARNTWRVLSEYGPLKGVPPVDFEKGFDNSFVSAR